MLSFVRSARAQPRSIQSRGFSAAAAAAAAKHNPTPHSAVRNHVPQFTNLPPIPKDFYIVDTTLREGEQFATCEFTSRDRVYIAKTLDSVGVDYIELVNPLASKQAARDCEEIAKLNLKSKIVAHTRCHMDDVRVACQSGINGVNLYMATSPILSKHSHGKGIDEVIDIASEVIKYVKQHKMEVRFSCEDAFRSNKDDILRIYAAVDKLGVNRVGVADTVGVAMPFEVYETLKAVRGVLKPTTDIEFHTHNDTGCCIANAFTALQGGATHIDTCVLGIGERNGITPLGGFLARMYTLDKETVMKKYDLKLLHHLERYVAQRAYVTIPFNNYITGMSAFTHKAGVHSKAVMQAPSAYEVIDPKDWGVERRIQFAHRLTGWNAMKQRAKDLGLEVSDEQIKAATVSIKNLAEDRPISMEELDTILLKLAKISAPQAQFIVWDEDVAEKSKGKKSESVQKQVDDVIRSLEPAKVDMRPTRKLQVKGHLFDKAVLNRLLDIIVDSPCEFTVLHLDVPANNASHSHAILQLWADSDDDISRTKSQLHAVVQALQPVAECELTDYTGPNHQHHAPPRRKN